MAKLAPSETERNKNLDALEEAVDGWVRDESTRLDNETKFLRSVLNGRNASNVGTKNLEATSVLVQEAISQFIGVG
jgi:hypothetical protein